MTNSEVPPAERRQHPRVPAVAPVEIRFHDLHTFIQEYSENISLGGMFIKTEDPRPIGSTLEFRLFLGDGYDIIRGMGRVVWLRGQTMEETPGMGVRFEGLNDQSRRVIDRMVRNRLASGGKGPIEAGHTVSPGTRAPASTGQ
jgi:type IV pilus assembly protein PilZ